MNKQELRISRVMLLNRLDELTLNLKSEVDSLTADNMLNEMRAIGNELLQLTNNPVADHQFINDEMFKGTRKFIG